MKLQKEKVYFILVKEEIVKLKVGIDIYDEGIIDITRILEQDKEITVFGKFQIDTNKWSEEVMISKYVNLSYYVSYVNLTEE